MFLAVLLGFAFENMFAIAKSISRITHYEFFLRHDQIALCGRDTWIEPKSALVAAKL